MPDITCLWTYLCGQIIHTTYQLNCSTTFSTKCSMKVACTSEVCGFESRRGRKFGLSSNLCTCVHLLLSMPPTSVHFIWNSKNWNTRLFQIFLFVYLFVIPYVMNFEHENYLKMWQRSFAKCSWMIRYNIHQYNIMYFPNPYISHLSKVQWFQMIFYTPQCDCRHQLERTGASYITTLLVLFSDNSWTSTLISAIHWHFR